MNFVLKLLRRSIRSALKNRPTKKHKQKKSNKVRIVQTAPVKDTTTDPQMTITKPQQSYEHCHNTDIYYLRNAKLDEKLMYQLAPFINANRPHDPPTKWQELKKQFGPPKDRIAPLSFKEIVKQSEDMNSKFVIGSKWWK